MSETIFVNGVVITIPDRPTACSTCMQPLTEDTVFRLQTETPGLEDLGDPSRLIGWHKGCVPSWVNLEDDHA